jgi:hypothetical protein
MSVIRREGDRRSLVGRNVQQACQWSRSIPLFQNMQMLTSGYLQM